MNLNFTAHSFRHSFANEYLNMSSATTLEGLKSILGHSSIKTTEIYADSSEIRAEFVGFSKKHNGWIVVSTTFA